ncbi:hypothetical protein JXL83_07760 [candidate division WOR-3 bacterium]|nr:hypothetical protein [candidate division WOR-3 bacterium]
MKSAELKLLTPLQRNLEEISGWGNHMRKYAFFIESNYESLMEELARKNLSDEIHLSHSLPDFDKQISREMAVIAGLEIECADKVKHLGTYYAIKLVQLNVTTIDFIRPAVIKSDPLKAYENFMREIGWKFRSLTSIFLENLIPILSADLRIPPFIIASVGTRTDMDDIDAAVITVDSDTKDLDKLLSRVNKVMTKYGTTMHFHLAESIDNGKYSATVAEFIGFAVQNVSNFVFITEIIGAKRIYGPHNLMEEFEEEVFQLFYPEYSPDVRYHEAYLRMILGEIRIYLNRKIESEYINPKNDALRMIKALITVQKTRYGIYKKNPWAVLDKLKYFDSKNWDIYKAIGESLAFVETLRFLFMLYGTQEELIQLDVPENVNTLKQIAGIMGIDSIGAVSSLEHLLIRYYDHLRRVKKIVEFMLDDCREYLKRITLINEVLTENKGNLAVNFAKNSDIFKGSDFWDDILEAFSLDDFRLLRVFARDYLSLDPRLRKVILKGLFSRIEYTFDGLVSFIVMLGTQKNYKEMLPVRDEFLLYLTNSFQNTPDLLFSLVGFFEKNNIGLCLLLESIDRETLLKIKETFANLREDSSEKKSKKSKNYNFKNVLNIYAEGSRYFRKYFQKILLSDPWIVKLIESEEKIEDICSGIFAEISRTVNRQTQKSLLTRFYNLKFLNIGLEAIGGKSYDGISKDFIELNNDYLVTLFDVCFLELEEQKSLRLKGEDLFLFFIVGSLARESSFNDDIDILVIMDTEETDLFTSYNKILSRMSREIVKTGTIPQFRLADHFGTYVTKMSDLKSFFQKNTSDTFIEKSQILESKLITGSEMFLEKFKSELIEEEIFTKWDIFAKKMLDEITGRHENNSDFIYNVKESPGGIKDIEMIFLILKAKYGVVFKYGEELVQELAERMPATSDLVARAALYLKQLREIRQFMRLTVSKTNVIDTTELSRNFKSSVIPYNGRNSSDFEEYYRRLMSNSRENLEKLIGLVFI